jgi:hypothetical protein
MTIQYSAVPTDSGVNSAIASKTISSNAIANAFSGSLPSGGIFSFEVPVVPALPTAAIIWQAYRSETKEEIDQLESLEANWDGYDADAISEQACGAARSFLASLPSSFETPDLSPNPTGTISMEWTTTGGKAQLELGKTKFSFYVRPTGGGTMYHKGELSHTDQVYAFLSVLYYSPRPLAITSIQY